MTEQSTENAGWANIAKLTNPYERKARLIPGLLTALFLLPLSATFGWTVYSWLESLAIGLGVSAVIGVGISHVSSAFGNIIQRKMWPDWPYDSPTNLWLHPDDVTRSQQQKGIWYAAIIRLTGLDILEAYRINPDEAKRVINDVVSELRHQLRKGPHADRLQLHNIHYGFARNFTGLRPVWITMAVISCAGCWIKYLLLNGELLWCIISTLLFLIALPFGYKVLPDYVRQKSVQYAESFFSAVLELDRTKT